MALQATEGSDQGEPVLVVEHVPTSAGAQSPHSRGVAVVADHPGADPHAAFLVNQEYGAARHASAADHLIAVDAYIHRHSRIQRHCLGDRHTAATISAFERSAIGN